MDQVMPMYADESVSIDHPGQHNQIIRAHKLHRLQIPHPENVPGKYVFEDNCMAKHKQPLPGLQFDKNYQVCPH